MSGVSRPELPSTPQWDAVAAEYERRVEPFTLLFARDLLDSLGPPPRTGARLLDLGCGTGGLSLLASSRGFSVTAADASPSMAEWTRRRTSDLGVECRVADGMALPPEWDGRFDCVAANFSVIFFPDPAAGLREAHRCLRPSGTLALSAWGDESETPAFRVFPDAAAEVAPDLAPRGRPGRIVGSEESLRSLLEGGGLVDVRVVGPVAHTLAVASPEEYYKRFALTSPPNIDMIANMEEGTARAFRDRVMELAAERGGRPDGGISLDSSAYFAFGTKPG